MSIYDDKFNYGMPSYMAIQPVPLFLKDICKGSISNIINKSVPIEKIKCGVYFLLKENEIVYVGQSTRVQMRISTHLSERKKIFDSVSFLEVEPMNLEIIESFYIHTLTPKYNRISCMHLNDVIKKIRAMDLTT